MAMLVYQRVMGLMSINMDENIGDLDFMEYQKGVNRI